MLYADRVSLQSSDTVRKKTMLSIGLMSGTSMDGIDASLVETDGEDQVKELACLSMDYDAEFKLLLHAAQFCVKEHQGDLQRAKNDYANTGLKRYLESELKMLSINLDKQLTKLNDYARNIMGIELPLTFDHVIEYSTKLHADVVLQLIARNDYQASDIDVVGYHGQALYHQPDQGISIVLGDGQLLANSTCIAVVNDFRSNDVAAGGQGAPFAPIYHQALAKQDGFVPAAVVNCGGIANITLILSDNPEDLIGFDTGPGNGLIDRLVRHRTQGTDLIDKDGKFGLEGTVNETTLAKLREQCIVKGGENYFDCKPPKSLDFGDLKLIEELNDLSLEDACATLEAFTAEMIVDSLKLIALDKPPTIWILAGGGWNNPVIKRELQQRLKNTIGDHVEIKEANDIGWNNQSLEAQIFAYFAVRSLQGKPLSAPGTTQVPKPMTGGHAFIPTMGATDAVTSLISANPAVLIGYNALPVQLL